MKHICHQLLASISNCSVEDDPIASGQTANDVERSLTSDNCQLSACTDAADLNSVDDSAELRLDKDDLSSLLVNHRSGRRELFCDLGMHNVKLTSTLFCVF